MLETFRGTRIFWQQLEIAKKLVAVGDARILPQLEPYLSHDDRHLRGNAAFIFAGLGSDRGFDVITAILSDRSRRGGGQGIPNGRWSLQGQIAADRYYAVHLLGELKDPKAVPVLVSLLVDEQVDYKVPWALGQIGGKRAVQGLLRALESDNSDVRVIAVEALGDLNAKEALPSLRRLLDDNERRHFGKLLTVSEAARAAIGKLDALR
ncbi:MAG TPA: HEAT repeat domain-containing protein [Clostridia bacterium]|nr:HEAT repeat domain-containing protein [Clostridia bacterium]